MDLTQVHHIDTAPLNDMHTVQLQCVTHRQYQALCSCYSVRPPAESFTASQYHMHGIACGYWQTVCKHQIHLDIQHHTFKALGSKTKYIHAFQTSTVEQQVWGQSYVWLKFLTGL